MKHLWIAMLCISTVALAQVPQQPTPELEAIGAKLMQEINAGIQCNANAVSGRRELEKLQAELKALKDKYEPEKKDAK